MPVSIQREVELTLTNTPLILVPRNKDRVLANRKREALKEKKEQKQAKKEAAKASAAKGKEKGKEKGKKVGKASKNGAKGHARSGGENKKAPLALIPTTIPKADPAPGTSAAPVIPAAPVNITPTSTKTSSNNKRKAADKVRVDGSCLFPHHRSFATSKLTMRESVYGPDQSKALIIARIIMWEE